MGGHAYVIDSLERRHVGAKFREKFWFADQSRNWKLIVELNYVQPNLSSDYF